VCADRGTLGYDGHSARLAAGGLARPRLKGMGWGPEEARALRASRRCGAEIKMQWGGGRINRSTRRPPHPRGPNLTHALAPASEGRTGSIGLGPGES
jgi:hypothetical protein